MLEKLSPIMPARNLAKAQEFYAALGFLTIYLDDEYLLMKREGAEIHFFLHGDLDPSTNYCGAYLRPSDIDALSREIAVLGLPETGIPRFEAAQNKPWGMREFVLVDREGNLIRGGQEI
jgi:catechol 2,3-dioxygenase-like lactoylglutathione lyase family enzyme